MIRVVIWQDKAGYLTGLKATGHALFADPGEDIVCAAVSTIIQAVVIGLEEVVAVSPRVVLEEGHLEITGLDGLDDRTSRDCQVLMKTAERSLQSLAADYPDHIVVTLKTGSDDG